MELSLETKKYNLKGVGTIAVVKLWGSLQQKNLPEIDETVQKFYDDGVNRIIFNLSKILTISSSGLGLIINLDQNAENSGEKLRWVLNERIASMMDLLGIRERLLIFSDEDKAFASWRN